MVSTLLENLSQRISKDEIKREQASTRDFYSSSDSLTMRFTRFHSIDQSTSPLSHDSSSAPPEFKCVPPSMADGSHRFASQKWVSGWVHPIKSRCCAESPVSEIPVKAGTISVYASQKIFAWPDFDEATRLEEYGP